MPGGPPSRHAPRFHTILVLPAMLLLASRVTADDVDQNGIDDDAERALAGRFCPAVQLHAPETTTHGLSTPVYPVPVEIMGLEAFAPPGNPPHPGLTADRLFVEWRQVPLGHPYGDHWVAASGWSPPLPESNPACNYAALVDDPPDYRYPLAPPGMPQGPYTLRFHWEFGNPAVGTPDAWYEVWQHGNDWTRPGADYPPTAYVHLFRCDGPGCAPDPIVAPTALVIQYWLFLPFNDWVNNHEGDWEGINVLVSSDDPEIAAITEIEYFAHKTTIARDATYYPALADHAVIVDGTHPVVFLGGHGYKEGCIGGTGVGEGSHGCYPTFGRWQDAGEGDPLGCFTPADDVIDHHAGPYVDWRDLAIHVVPDPDAPGVDYDAEPWRAWLAADLRWGTRRVPSVGGELVADVGNRAPHGPAYNPERRWNRTARASVARPYIEPGLPRARPYHPADRMGWVPFALFLDTFSGETAGGALLEPTWQPGTGSWQVLGGRLCGTGDGSRTTSNRAVFQAEREPGWYDLPFVTINPRLTHLACDVSVDAPLPDSTQVGVTVQGGASDSQQVRIVWWRAGGVSELRAVYTWDAGTTYAICGSAVVPELGPAPRRLEVVTLDRGASGVALHDVRVDGTLLLDSVPTPAIGDDARALVVDGMASACFDRVAVSYARAGDAYRYPPFVTWLEAPAAGDTILAAPRLLAWIAVDEKHDDAITAQTLALSTDGGAGWSTIAALDGAARTHLWSPPVTPAPYEALLRLAATDLDGDTRAAERGPFVVGAGTSAIHAAGDGPGSGRPATGWQPPHDLTLEVDAGPSSHCGGAVTCRLTLPGPCAAHLRIVAVTGRHVRTLLDRPHLSRGVHGVCWDRRDQAGAPVAAGAYFCILEAGGRRRVQRVIVLH